MEVRLPEETTTGDQAARVSGSRGESRFARGVDLQAVFAFSAVFATAFIVLTGCQSYEPRPLDSSTHIKAWQGRNLESESLQAGIERIDQDLRREVGEFNPADGLSLAEGQLAALVFNPELRLARLRLARATAGASEAASWPDPELTLNALQLSESAPDPWVLTQGLKITLPLSGRVGAYKDLKDARQQIARHEVREGEWGVMHALAHAWVQWSAVTLRIEETQRHLDTLTPLVEATSKLAASGELLSTEAALFSLERAQRQGQLRGFRGEADELEQRLRAAMGLAPGTAVLFLPSLTSGPPSEEGADAVAAQNPSLARLREEYEASEQTLRMEIAKQWSDFTFGPVIESDEGRRKVGLLTGIGLPLWNANREAIAEARIDRELARATLETVHEALLGRLAAATLRAASLEQQRIDIEETLAPLLDRQVADAARLVQLGEGTTMVLLESISRAHKTKLDWIDVRARKADAQHERAFLIGPARLDPLPASKEEAQ